MTKLPEVRIRFAQLLYNGISQELLEYYELKYPDYERKEWERKMPTMKWCLQRVEDYRSEWSKNADSILCAMQDLFKLTFYKPVIDAFVAPFLPEQSTPLLLATRREPDELVDVLTHELIHVLLSDNGEMVDCTDVLVEMFPDRTPRTRIHIIVHAGLKHLYLDVLKDESRLKRDISDHAKFPAYKEAWEVVEEVGYEKLITDFVGHYAGQAF